MKNVVSKTSILAGLLIVFGVTVASAATTQMSSGVKKMRDYPGGRDEDELKVQEKLKPVVRKVYKRQLEEQVLKTFLKPGEAVQLQSAEGDSEAAEASGQ